MTSPQPAVNLDDADRLREALESIAVDSDPQALIDIVVKLLINLSGENKRLQLRLAKAMRSIHGRKSEKLNAAQLALFRELLTDTETSKAASEAPGADKGGTDKGSTDTAADRGKRRAKPHGRGKLPDNLPRVDNVIPVADEDRVCGTCGTTKVCIGHEVSERLDYVPATLRVIRDMREKVACRPCQGSVAIAPSAPKVVEGGLAAEGLLAHVCVSKFIDGLTLTRLAKIYARSGVVLAESTLGDFVSGVAHSLLRVAKHIEQQALASYVINQDDTGLRVLDRDHPKGIKRGHIWTFCGDGRWAVYRYSPDWKGEHPCTFLEAFAGVVQGDGYAGINGLFEGADALARRAGCMMHCRRYFYDAYQAGDQRGGIALAIIHDIYEIEREAKQAGLGPAEREQLRRERSIPLMARLKAWIDQVAGGAAPKSPLGKATTYAKNQWETLLVPFSDGRLEIDNGEAERRLKVLATGRKNWLFAGSDKGAERIATILTVLGTAVLQGVDPLAYLTYILGRIAAGVAGSSIADLMPAAWAKNHGKHAHTEQAPIPRLVG